MEDEEKSCKVLTVHILAERDPTSYWECCFCRQCTYLVGRMTSHVGKPQHKQILYDHHWPHRDMEAYIPLPNWMNLCSYHKELDHKHTHTCFLVTYRKLPRKSWVMRWWEHKSPPSPFSRHVASFRRKLESEFVEACDLWKPTHVLHFGLLLSVHCRSTFGVVLPIFILALMDRQTHVMYI